MICLLQINAGHVTFQLRSFNWDKILNCTHQPALPDTATVLSMDIELLHLRNLMQRYRLRIENNKTLIRDLEVTW